MTPRAALRETALTAAEATSIPEIVISSLARPMTGEEYQGRNISRVYATDERSTSTGDRVKDVTTHPAFRNSVRMTARLYNSLHDQKTREVLTCPTDTGNGSYTMRFFRSARSAKDLVADRDAIAAWARLTYGWMGRSPDYKASFLGTLGSDNVAAMARDAVTFINLLGFAKVDLLGFSLWRLRRSAAKGRACIALTGALPIGRL